MRGTGNWSLAHGNQDETRRRQSHACRDQGVRELRRRGTAVYSTFARCGLLPQRCTCASIRAQTKTYEHLPSLRQAIPEDSGLSQIDGFVGLLIRVSAFDLGQDRISSFGAYRFLYERLIGASARPWFPAAFCAAASLPHLHPHRRRALLQSISEAAATAPGWSTREPVFFPEWVEKVEA